ncbi:MAG: hypothetical protein NUV63_12250 [Gallionella sp.]|nr:hypothetical protein [Gallionella sp.]
MELKLSEKEVKEILLRWAETEWPQAFNEVDFGGSYNKACTFSKAEPAEVTE